MSKKRTNLSVLVILITSFVLLAVSCKEYPETVQIFQTPTIRGTIDIPVGANVSGGDFRIRVMEGDKAVYTGKVNSDGSFTVSGLSENASYDILVTTASLGEIATESRDLTIEATSGYGGWLGNVTASLDVSYSVGSVPVSPLGTITGSVTIEGISENEMPMITVFIPGTSFLSTVGDDGTYSLTNVPQSAIPYKLRFWSIGYLTQTKDGILLHSNNNIENPVIEIEEVTMVRNTGSIEGFAIRDGEADNSGIIIRLEQEGSTANLSTSTASNGYFRIDNVSPGKYRALASYSGYLSQASDFYEIVPAGLISIAEKIELAQNIGTIRGSASIPGSSVNGGISITITGIDSDKNYSAITTEDGSFSRNVPAGSYRVSAHYPGYSSKSVEITVFQGASAEAVIGDLALSSGIVTGRAVLDGVFDDYSGIIVTLTNTTDSNEKYSSFTDNQGSYTITGIPKGGDFTVECSKAGFIKNSAVLVNVSIGVSNVVPTITLKNLTSKVTGTIMLEGTEDYTGVSAMLRGNGLQYDATTDQNGEFIMSKVFPGEYSLIVSKSGYVSKTIDGIIIESATTKTLDIVSLSIGTRSVTGTLNLELRTDHSGALITATNLSETKTVYSAITNSSGTYTLAGMKPGEYSITLSCAGYNTATLPTVNVIDGAEKTLESYQLLIARGTILGTALLEGRGSNSGVKAELMKGAEVYATTTTDDSGLYSFSVPQGNYSGVRLSCDNFKSVSIAQSIALIANDYVTIGGEGSSTEMIATHVPVVRGRLSVKGLLGHDYSGIRVSLIENGMATTTDEDGYWSFAKVPVGNYTLKIERENTNVVTKIIDVVAAAEKNIETIELIPNAASIEGHVTLNGKTDHSGITVRATAEGMTELSTKTNAAGYFYLGNVVTTETYTLYFEKDGWVSLTRQVSGLEDLSLNDITEVNPIKLVDTANPELISISVVVGNSELEGRKLNVYFNASDEGSGLSKVYVNTCDDFTDIEAQNYSNPFSCYVDDTEGEHTLYIKVADAAGNLSEIVSQVFRISDFKTSVASVLLDNEDGANDGIITWTKNRSPYYVTGSILVDENTTLIIEPGVNVQFSGAHYIQVEGTIKIIGTESEKVYLYGVGNGENTWKGIKGVNDRGNCISFAVMTNMLEGMQGYLNISDCSISSVDGGYSVGGTSSLVGGTVKNSVINGGVSASDSLFDNCIIDVGSIEQIDENGKSIYECYLNDCQFSGEEITAIHCNIDNSAFSEMTIHLNSCDGIHSSFRDCKLSVKKSNNFFHAFGGYLRCVFDGCSFENFSSSGINESNIINCGVIKITTKKDEFDYLDFSRNYWGPTNTLELNNGVINLSFIEDYYDDFNNSRVEVTGYYSDEVENAGPLTVSRSDSTFVVGSEGPAGGIVFYDKGYYSDGWRYLEVSPNSFDNCCFGYNRTTDNGNNLRNGTGYGIGFGRYNTARIVENMGDIAYSSESGSSKSPIYAAKVCDDYQVNGYSDWFLPSISELNLIFNNLGSGILKNKYGHYWSSSDYFRLGAAMMTYVSDYASTDWNYSSFEYGVLPIRMF